jgi:hypothetical protein
MSYGTRTKLHEINDLKEEVTGVKRSLDERCPTLSLPGKLLILNATKV